MGTIRRGSEYETQITMVRRGSKRNKTSFHVWKTHMEAPFCDDEFERMELEHESGHVSQVVVLRAENRVVLKIATNGDIVSEIQTVFVPTVIDETELLDNSGSSSDGEDDIAF